MKPRWITPSANPAGTRGICLQVPDVPEFWAVLRGLFRELSDCERWERSEGGMTPCDAAAWCAVMWQSFEDKTGCS